MKQATTGWIEKAEEDFAAARQVLASSDPLYGVVCFHAQQCVEKYFKALLQEQELRIPRVHDLDALAAKVELLAPGITGMRHEIQQLTTYAVDIRYPGPSADRAEAEAALTTADLLRHAIRRALGLPGKTE